MDAADLYGLPLERFTAERNALAKELRSAGRRDEATEVVALRKPSVAAWAVNQLVRTQARSVTQLVKAGDALREAQAGMLAGRSDAAALRASLEQERAVVANLTDTARGLLSSEGHELSGSILERVADTLHAAALDDEARKLITDGRLERELRRAGLGVGDSPSPGPAKAKPAKADARSSREAADAESERGVAKRRAEDDEKRAQLERAQARKQAQAAEAQARRHAERADGAVLVAEQRHDRAAAALQNAEDALTQAHADADAAATALAVARERLQAS